MTDLAGALFEKGEYKQAAEIFETLLAGDTINPLVTLNLGRCYQELKKPKLALEKYVEALDFFKQLKNAEF